MAGEMRQGGWVLEKSLGAGGFGKVDLWRNQETAEYVALKQCRAVHDMKPKHRERWQLECQIMMKLDHDHVIKALTVPSALREKPGEPPVLAMEYCQEGDLRKVLNQPQHCCGLRERQVRAICRDVASAIEYLHTCHIIHRDLKPENIVLQRVDQRVLYKLIDLGYAKDLEEDSLCISFVGTMQYLAPELFLDSRYNHTVDYWSFGTTVFECIVGIRPFLHNMAPVKWQTHVHHKTDKHIHAVMGPGSKVQFSDRLPKPNHLCRITQPFIEHFLRLILRWSPQERGGRITTEDRPECFTKLHENLISTKVIHVFWVSAGRELTYSVPPERLLSEVHTLIAQETNIPINQLELLLNTGVSAQSHMAAHTYCSNTDEEDIALFLFCQNDTTFRPDRRKTAEVPAQVSFMLQQPTAMMVYEDKKRAWSQAVFYITSVSDLYQRLIEAQSAANSYFLRLKSSFTVFKNQMASSQEDLQSKMSFFQRSLAFDLQRYEKQRPVGIASKEMHSKWETSKSSVAVYDSLVEEARDLERHCSGFDVRVDELQRSPVAKAEQTDSIKQICVKAYELYTELRKTPTDLRKQATSNEKMIVLVRQCMKEWDQQSRDLYLHIGKVIECRQELERLEPRVRDVTEKMEEAKRRVVSHQESRQKDLWRLVSVALKNVSGARSADAGPDLSTPPNSGGGDGVDHFSINMVPSRNRSSQPDVLQLMSEATTQVQNDSILTKHRLESLIQLSQTDSVTDPDWSFLEDAMSGVSIH